MPLIGVTPSRAVIAEDVRDHQNWPSHGRRRYGAGDSSLSRFARRRRRGALRPSSGLSILAISPIATRLYRAVVSSLECPSNAWITRMSLPRSSRWGREAVAKRMQRDRLAQPRGFGGLLE